MGRVVGFFAVVLFFPVLYSLPKMKGRALVFLTPSVDSQDLQEARVKVEIQKEKLLIFENAICQSLDPCLASPRTGNSEQVVQLCDQAARTIASLQVPAELPESVRENLEVYRNSSVYSAGLMARRWWSKQMKVAPQTDITFFNSYEIDTCGYESIPQKIRRLYGFDVQARTRLVHCEDIRDLAAVVKAPEEANRLPASSGP